MRQSQENSAAVGWNAGYEFARLFSRAEDPKHFIFHGPFSQVSIFDDGGTQLYGISILIW